MALGKALQKLSGARFTIAREYLDGRIDRGQAMALSQKYSLLLEQSFDFTSRSNLSTQFQLIRKFDRFFVALKFFHDETNNESGVSFNIYPEGLGYGADVFSTGHHAATDRCAFKCRRYDPRLMRSPQSPRSQQQSRPVTSHQAKPLSWQGSSKHFSMQ